MNRGAKISRSLQRRGRKRRARLMPMFAIPSAPLSDNRTDRPEQPVPGSKFSQLISAALEDAVAALADRDPETFLQLRAWKVREPILEELATRRSDQHNVGTVVRECRRAISFQNIELDLALELVNSFRRYIQLSSSESPDQPTVPHQN